MPLPGEQTGEQPGLASDLQGASRLTVDAVLGVTSLVEAMHRNIGSASSLAGVAPVGPTTGITGLVYRSVRSVSRAVGMGLDVALGALVPLLAERPRWPARGAVLSALNGVLGDHLDATANPLAIPMSLRRHEEQAAVTGKVLVLVHGLCMNDHQWLRDGHEHGLMLADELAYTPVYLHYNSGRHISVNGRQFAQTLEEMLSAWPVPVEQLVIMGHSMGGLVARSAAHYAAEAGLAWPRQLAAMVFLGTPHHGAPLERVGSVIDMLLGSTPYSAPLARIGLVRSAGIQDLRHGNVIDEHWGRRRPSAPTSSTCRPMCRVLPLQPCRAAARKG